MTHIFLNGLGASAGAGLTYLYNVVPRLSLSPNVSVILALQPQLRPEFRNLTNVDLLDVNVPTGVSRRFWFEQRQLPQLIQASGADILISAGNFALRNSPIPQILLSGNSLYTSPDFYRDLRRRGAYRMWLDTQLRAVLARRSVFWADCTIAPSKAFAAELQRWTGKGVTTVYHGFDTDVFFRDSSPLPEAVRRKLDAAQDCLRLLFVSHYNYYRNFETLFRGIAILKSIMRERKVRLLLTCALDDSRTPGTYKTRTAARLIRELGIRDEVVELGAIPYRLLHQVYRACNIYVTPAYAETFAHPLVEAMACGLPIVASDIPVHREICEDRALFFERFSAERLAACIAAVKTGENAWRPAPLAFSWKEHLQQILAIAAELRQQAHAQAA